jgi:mRNA interferase HicA
MKRIALIRHIEAHGAVFVREGGGHTVYRNPQTNRSSTIPRHNEINDICCRKYLQAVECTETLICCFLPR